MTDTPPAISPTLRLSDLDNVLVLRRPMAAGASLDIDGRNITLAGDRQLGDKLARRAIRSGEKIIKFGAAIGTATRDIAPGEHVHLHNMQSGYLPTYTLEGLNRFIKEP